MLSCQRNGEVGTHSRSRQVLCGSTNQNSDPSVCSETTQTDSCALSTCRKFAILIWRHYDVILCCDNDNSAGWTNWSSWTKCSIECGGTGLKSRTRSCSDAEIGSQWCRCGGSSPIIGCAGCLNSGWHKITNQSEASISEPVINGYHDETNLGYVQVEKCDSCRK